MKQAYFLTYDLKMLYNLLLVYQSKGDLENAEKHLLLGIEKEPQNPRILNAMSIFYAEKQNGNLLRN